MKKFIIGCIACCSVTHVCDAQKYYTKNGNISFFSKTSVEDIKASNNQVLSVLNIQSGELQFSVIVKSFHFPKALMEEHFNENYLESDKYPKSTFKGTISDISKVNFAADGDYPVTVSGDLTIHGITNKINSKGTISIKGGKINGKCTFMVALADYKVDIPKVVEANIAKTIQVKVDCLYDQKM